MGLSRLSKKCKECPHVFNCECKKMEAYGYITGVDLSSEHKNELASWSAIDVSAAKHVLVPEYIISLDIQPMVDVTVKNLVDELTEIIYSKLDINSELLNKRNYD